MKKLFLLLVVGAFVCSFAGSSLATAAKPQLKPVQMVKSGIFAEVRSAGGNGLNNDPSERALHPQLTVFGSKLYATWDEVNDSRISQIRVKFYDGSTWSPADGGGANGLNKDPSQGAAGPQLTVFGSKLYATWRESNGTALQIRVAAYDGSAWAFVDGGGANGINSDPSNNAADSQLTVFGNKLYAIWNELNGSDISQVRVKSYDGSTWSFVDGGGANGINKDVSKDTSASQLTVLGGKLYATWMEGGQIRVKSYDGTTWAFVDGGGANGLNNDLSKDASNPQLAIFGNRLYATWEEVNGSRISQIRVKSYDGSTWSPADGGGANGLNKDPSTNAYAPQLAMFGDKLYATWYEFKGGNTTQIRVRSYDGSQWVFVDGGGANGLNIDPSKVANHPELTVFGSKLYLTWSESDGSNISQIRIAVGQ